MEPKKVIFPAKKHINQMFTIATIMLVGGLIASLTIGAMHLLVFGVIYLVMAFSTMNKQMIKLYEHNMEIKFAPLASTMLIKYKDIERTEKISDKKIMVHYKVGANAKKFRVPVHLLEPNDLKDFLFVLKNKRVA